MKKKDAILRCVAGVLLLLLLLLIFGASYQTGEESSGLSADVMELFNGFLAFLGLPFVATEHFIRKAAHFTEYTALGLLWLVNLRLWLGRPALALPWALLAGLLVAALDEFLQSFIPGRGSMVADVLLDFCGVVTGAVLVMLFSWLSRRRKSKRLREE